MKRDSLRLPCNKTSTEQTGADPGKRGIHPQALTAWVGRSPRPFDPYAMLNGRFLARSLKATRLGALSPRGALVLRAVGLL
jgi:hypothetical protein